MTAQAERQIDPADEADLTNAVDATIAEHGGDAREAVKALLICNALLEQAHDRALTLVSHGYMRGRRTGGEAGL
ncbi:MAG: hypothetical protein WDN02_12765 [Methylovirgula sp.]|uniref:hypothetical protein n=1 Tax=Methylovirgula sp. TaxID=1978224 RepID=UPI00307605DE